VATGRTDRDQDTAAELTLEELSQLLQLLVPEGAVVVEDTVVPEGGCSGGGGCGGGGGGGGGGC